MIITPTEFIAIALWLHFWGMVDDGYSGRSREANWFFAHVVESMRREVLFIAGYALVIDIHGIPSALVAFLVVGLHSAAWWLGEQLGLALRKLIPPDEKPDKLAVNLTKLLLGLALYLFYLVMKGGPI